MLSVRACSTAVLLAPCLASEASLRLLPPAALPLRTHGHDIIDATGALVPLACVNWYGAHLEQMVSNGLNVQPLANITATIVRLGFNCVRLPFSLDLVLGKQRVPRPRVALAANPELIGRSPLEVFDATVEALTKARLLVILNNHISSAQWCCSDDDKEGLWYTEAYPETAWLEGLELLARRYRNNPHVAGFDLRNELRSSSHGVPTWGSGVWSTDWALAAVKGGQRVHVAKDMLIFISGLDYSMFLCDVRMWPLHRAALSGRVVYTSHTYSWLVSELGAFQYQGRLLSGLYLATLASWCGLLVLGLALRRCSARARTLFTRHSIAGRRSLQAQAATAVFYVALRVGRWVFSPCRGNGSGVKAIVVICPAGALSWLLWARASCAWMALALQVQSKGANPRWVPGLSAEVIGGPTEAEEARELHPPQELNDWHPVRKAIFNWRLCLLACTSLASLAAIVSAWHSLGSYEAFAEELDLRWGFLLTGSTLAAPVWLGEFGTDTEDLWWKHLMRYARERPLGWAYWPLNGEKRTNLTETYGILMEDSATVRHAWKLEALQELIGVMARRVA